MRELLLIALLAALANNVVLAQFLGICPFLGVSKNIKMASGMGAAVMFVITIASIITDLIYRFILNNANIAGGHLVFLQTIVFILVIAALVQFVEMVLKKYSKPLYKSLGVYLPLIATNCAVLGVALLNVQKGYGIAASIVNAVFTGLGFMISIVILASIRERIDHNDVPRAFKGTPIVLITAGLMAIAFMGFGNLQ